MIARLEKLFFFLLALFPFAMGAVYAFVNIMGGWVRFSGKRGFGFYFMPSLEVPHYVFGMVLCAAIFSFAAWMSRRKIAEVPRIGNVAICAAIVFALAVSTRLSFLLAFGGGMANTLDPGEAWVRAGGSLTDGFDVRITNWGHYAPWWTCYSLLMKFFILVFGDHFELFMAMQTLFGGLTAVAILLLAIEVLGSLQLAVFASVLYSLMPSNIVYFTAIGNPEHVAIAFHVMAVWLVVRWLMRKMSVWSSLLHCVLAGFVVAIGDSFKPFFVNLFVATSIAAFVMIVRSGYAGRLVCTRKVVYGIFLMIVVNALTHAGTMTMINRVYGVKTSVFDTIPHTLSTGLHRLGEGQVFLSPTGMTYCQLRDSGVSRNEATRIVLGKVLDDWKVHWKEVPLFFLKKTIWTWHDDCCAFYYYEYNRIRGAKVLKGKTIERIRKYGSATALVMYFCLMVAASAFSFKIAFVKTVVSHGYFVCGLIVLGFMMLLLFTEGAMRYKCVVMPYIIIFASGTFSCLLRRLLDGLRWSARQDDGCSRKCNRLFSLEGGVP